MASAPFGLFQNISFPLILAELPIFVFAAGKQVIAENPPAQFLSAAVDGFLHLIENGFRVTQTLDARVIVYVAGV